MAPNLNDLVYVDHRLISLSKARLSPFNSAFLFGECLLEAVPIYGDKALFFDQHLDRLEKGCQFLGWSFPPFGRFERAIRLYRNHPLTPQNFMIRFGLVQEIEPPAHPRQFSPSPPRLFAMIRPLRHTPLDFWPKSGRSGISPWTVPDSSAVPGQFKWIFYMMVRQDFRKHPEWDEMLRLNDRGFVVDGGSSSPLWFDGRNLCAPPLKNGGLESITRLEILKICKKLGIKVVEKFWRPLDVLKRGELFFAGSGIGILSITHLQGRLLKHSGSLALRLWQQYRKRILS